MVEQETTKSDGNVSLYLSNDARPDWALKVAGTASDAFVIGNSSSGLIEGSYFGIPVINIGSRQIGREKAKNVIDVTNDVSDTIKRKILSATNSKKHRYPRSYIYGKGNSSKKIVKYLETIKISKELIEKRLL